MDQLLRWGRDAVLLAAAAAIPAALGGLFLFLLRLRTAPPGSAARSALVDALIPASLIGIAVIGLRPGLGETPEWQQWNFIPFQDVMRSLSEPDWVIEIAVANLLGNALIYVPWGLAAGIRFRSVRLPLFVAVTVTISLLVEVGQALEASGRTSDVTDVIMNTLGASAAFVIARTVAARWRPADDVIVAARTTQ